MHVTRPAQHAPRGEGPRRGSLEGLWEAYGHESRSVCPAFLPKAHPYSRLKNVIYAFISYFRVASDK